MQFNIGVYKIFVFEQIEFVATAWQSLVNKNDALLTKNLKAIEESEIKNLKPYYLLVSKNNKNIGIIYLQLLNFNLSFIEVGVLNKWYFIIIKKIMQGFQTKLLFCGNLFRINFKSFEGIDAGETAMIIKTIAEKKHLGWKPCGIMLKDLSEKLPVQIIKKYKYKPMHEDVTMLLNIKNEWQNFDNYLSDLSRKYRKRAEKILEAAKPIDVKSLTLEEITINAEKIEFLYYQVAKRQTIRLGVLGSKYFIAMKKNLGKEFDFQGYFLGEEMIAFSSHIYYKNAMEIHYIGINYTFNEKHQLYFNILFNGLHTAIIKKKNTLELGRTAKEAKASLGALPFENMNYYCINNPFFEKIYSTITKRFSNQMGENWANRNPLK